DGGEAFKIYSNRELDMIITLSPQNRSGRLTVVKDGDALTLNNETVDFSAIPDGATLPSDAVDCEFITGDVERIDGVLHLALILPHGPDASEAARFPEPIIDPADGPLELPQ